MIQTGKKTRDQDLSRGPIGYSEQYDAYYYLDNNEWIEPRCSDRECEFCRNRPERYNGR